MPELSLKCRCGSVLMKVRVNAFPNHMDVFCGICETFFGHLWFSNFVDNDNKPILPETLVEPETVAEA